MAKKIKKIRTSAGHRKEKKKKSGSGGFASQHYKLQQALALHQAGRLNKAEELYRQILAVEPNQPDALHFLGMLAHQVGKSDFGVELISKALNNRPGYVEAYINLGNIFRSQGKLDEAIASYRRALVLQPDFADGHYNLGNALKDQGKLDEAIKSYRQALVLQPSDAEVYVNLGNTLNDQDKPDEAIACFRQAINLRPDYVEAHMNLGNILKNQGRLNEAVTVYRQALSLRPDYADLHYNLGTALVDKGKFDEAIASFSQALTLQPDYAEPYINLGNVFKDQGRLEEAAACYRKALTLQPDNVLVLYNLGTSLMAQGELEKAITSFRRALVLKPDYAEVYNNLGNALKGQGLLKDAIACYRKALALNADYTEVHSNLLFCLNYMADSSQEEIYTESLQWNERHVQPLQKGAISYANKLSTERRLRIGYVSPDFRVHSVAFFIEPVLKVHNKEKVEVFCYANVRKPDSVTQRLRAYADHWFTIRGVTYDAVAEQIKKDRIDILVDLAGHTSDNSLPVFARKPAPVQVSWLGYPNTTGLQTMDFRLTDAISDPPCEDGMLHSEKLIRLKYGFLCYQPIASAPQVSSLPYLGCGHIIFGSFNNLTKVTPEVVKAWAEILQAVPDSRLLLKAKQLSDDQTRKRIKNIFAHYGIGHERLEIQSTLARINDHLELYSRVDIGLDPFPYNGTTTTCEALWMGVPVVTLLGSRHAGRVGASILHRIGLDDLVADSVDEYVDLARVLASDKKRLQDLRSGLRQRMQNSELMDSIQFTNHLEDIYRRMWREYCEKIIQGNK